MSVHKLSTLIILTFIFCTAKATEEAEVESVTDPMGSAKTTSSSCPVKKSSVKPKSSPTLSIPPKSKYDWFAPRKKRAHEQNPFKNEDEGGSNDEGDTNDQSNEDSQEQDPLMFSFDSEWVCNQ